MIVSSDVLVYFGDLAPVLTNFARVLRPGGWLILTLENAGDAPRGWVLNPSRAPQAYRRLPENRADDGGVFGAEGQSWDCDLRYEFGAPVRGFGVAAQRLALFG